MSSETTDAAAGQQDPGAAAINPQELSPENLAQVDMIARRIHRHLPRHVLVEDLVNAGVLGLIDAIQKYDASKHVQFRSYAKFRIRGAILDSLRELDWGSRALRRHAREISQVESRLSTMLQRTPTHAELAEELDIGLSELESRMAQIWGLQMTSLASNVDNVENPQAKEPPAPPSPDNTPYLACLRAEMHDILSRLLADMPSSERRVLLLYYFEELTMHEIGRRMGLGQSRVSQIHSSALCHLRARLQNFSDTRNATGADSRCTKKRMAAAGASAS